MSLGLRGYTPAFQVVIDALRGQGVLPVIAVGNEGPRTSRSPGNYTNVISVGACDAGNLVADFSSSQQFDRVGDPFVPDLVGQGVEVLSCVPNGGYAKMDGSSMATPHLAGLAALLLESMPNATPDMLEQAIFDSCNRPGTMLPERANRGVPNAPSAYQALTGNDLPAPPAARRRTQSASGRKAARKSRRKPAGARKAGARKSARKTPRRR
jgi:subtilisin family serine protease